MTRIMKIEELPKEFEMPEGLYPEGKSAWEVIVKFLKEHDLLDSGGHSKVFYSPREWKERKEDYGGGAFLIIVHDGGSHGDAFSYDRENYEVVDSLADELEKVGLYPEQCTRWYSAVYAIR